MHFYHTLTDYSVLKYHRFFTQVITAPGGALRFPDAPKKVARLEEIMLKRIPAEFLTEILKLTAHV